MDGNISLTLLFIILFFCRFSQDMSSPLALLPFSCNGLIRPMRHIEEYWCMSAVTSFPVCPNIDHSILPQTQHLNVAIAKFPNWCASEAALSIMMHSRMVCPQTRMPSLQYPKPLLHSNKSKWSLISSLWHNPHEPLGGSSKVVSGEDNITKY